MLLLDYLGSRFKRINKQGDNKMDLTQFEKTYNIDNGWIGPWEMDDGRLKMAKTVKKYSKTKHVLADGTIKYYKHGPYNQTHYEYFTIYNIIF